MLRRRPEPADRTYHIAQSHTRVARLTRRAYRFTHTRIKIITPAARNGIALLQTAAAAHRMPNGSSPMIRPGGKATRASPHLDTGKLQNLQFPNSSQFRVCTLVQKSTAHHREARIDLAHQPEASHMTEIAVHRAHMQHLIKCYMRTALMDTAYRMPISLKTTAYEHLLAHRQRHALTQASKLIVHDGIPRRTPRLLAVVGTLFALRQHDFPRCAGPR